MCFAIVYYSVYFDPVFLLYITVCLNNEFINYVIFRHSKRHIVVFF